MNVLKRLGPICLAFALLVAGCGDGGGRREPERTSRPGAVNPEAEEEQVNKPKSGEYVYETDGRDVDPDYKGYTPDPNKSEEENKEAERQSRIDATIGVVLEGSTLTESVTVDGELVESRITGERPKKPTSAAFLTIERRWEEDRVLLVSTPGCTLDPPPAVLHNPIKVEEFDEQTWDAPGCEGTMNVEVVGTEKMKDANDKEWATWRIEIRNDSKTPAGSTNEHEIRWFSPELGMNIRTELNSVVRPASPDEPDRRRLFLTVLKTHP